MQAVETSPQPARRVLAAAGSNHPHLGTPATIVALGLILTAFVMTRAVYITAGNLFRMNFGFHQYMDPELLKSHLWQTIFYLHAQPPLMNLILGLGLKLFPQSYPAAFRVFFMAIGLVLAITFFLLMIELHIPPWLSLTITLLFELNPGTVMFENWFYDTYPATALLCLAAYFLVRFIRTHRRAWGAAFLVALASLVFLNATFQIVWFVGMGAILLLLTYDKMRPILPIGVIMLALILMLYLKNLILFGVFSTSSWVGEHLKQLTTLQLQPDERNELVAAHKLSELALSGPYPAVATPGNLTGIPVLDELWKSGGLGPNCNQTLYIKISEIDLRDALWVMEHRPDAYARGVLTAVTDYLIPAADLFWFAHPKLRIPRWCTDYEWMLVRIAYPPNDKSEVSVVVAIAIPVLLAFAAWTMVRVWKSRAAAGAVDVTLFFVAAAVLYLAPTGMLIAIGDNSRYRFVANPFYLVLAATLICRRFPQLGSSRVK